MFDLIQFLDSVDNISADVPLRRQVDAHVAALRASASRGNRHRVRSAEETVKLEPERSFSFDSAGTATLRADGQTSCAGRFETPSISELRARCMASAAGAAARGRVKLWVLDGASPATDIGSLQATSTESTLFQVASQFNCLESPGPSVTPVSNYFNDPTQGPRASISAFPATLLRHYSAPDAGGGRFVQETDGRQIDLLADALGPGACRNGYFTGRDGDGQGTLDDLAGRFDRIRVGVHDAAQVVLGYDWDGEVERSESRRIAQVFTSTVAGGGYGGERALGSAFGGVCRQLLRAAYLGTLLAAASLGRDRVVLTLIGGGVFGNPVSHILEAISWAVDEAERLLAKDLCVVVNGYSLGNLTDLRSVVLPLVQARGGAIIRFDRDGIAEVLR
jgi:hypothetical protein